MNPQVSVHLDDNKMHISRLCWGVSSDMSQRLWARPQSNLPWETLAAGHDARATCTAPQTLRLRLQLSRKLSPSACRYGPKMQNQQLQIWTCSSAWMPLASSRGNKGTQPAVQVWTTIASCRCSVLILTWPRRASPLCNIGLIFSAILSYYFHLH